MLQDGAKAHANGKVVLYFSNCLASPANLDLDPKSPFPNHIEGSEQFPFGFESGFSFKIADLNAGLWPKLIAPFGAPSGGRRMLN